MAKIQMIIVIIILELTIIIRGMAKDLMHIQELMIIMKVIMKKKEKMSKGVDIVAEEEVNIEAEVDSEVQTEPEVESEVEEDSEVEVKTEVEVDSEVKTGVEVDSEVKTGVEKVTLMKIE